jgi:pimeloyl-ACP methyl ester carboxylesterase
MHEPDRVTDVEPGRTRIRVWEWGDEHAPPVICIHGAYDHGRMWDGLAPRVAALGFRVLAPDLPGHGDSGRLSSGHAWAAVALELALLARHAGPPVGLIGHSFGGGQAIYVAGVWPELARWVVSLDGLGPPQEVFGERPFTEAAAAGLASAERALVGPQRVYGSLDDMAARRGRVNHRLPREWIDHLVRHGARPTEGGFVWKSDPLFAVGFPAEFSLEHLDAEFAQVRCPVLALTGGEHDTWSDLSDDETARRVACFADARHTAIAGAGHYLHIEALDEVVGAISRFVAEVDGR